MIKEIWVYTDLDEEHLEGVIDIAGDAIEYGSYADTKLEALRCVESLQEKENYRVFKLSIEEVPQEEVTAYFQSAVEPHE